MGAYPLSVVVEERLQFDNVWVANDSHNLQLSVLCIEVRINARLATR